MNTKEAIEKVRILSEAEFQVELNTLKLTSLTVTPEGLRGTDEYSSALLVRAKNQKILDDEMIAKFRRVYALFASVRDLFCNARRELACKASIFLEPPPHEVYCMQWMLITLGLLDMTLQQKEKSDTEHTARVRRRIEETLRKAPGLKPMHQQALMFGLGRVLGVNLN